MGFFWCTLGMKLISTSNGARFVVADGLEFIAYWATGNSFAKSFC